MIAEVGRGGTTPDGRPFFVTEEVAGELIHLDSSARKLDLDARLRLFLRVCEAVSHAYRALVVHRDLEPSDIRVTADGVPRLLEAGRIFREPPAKFYLVFRLMKWTG